jgi:peptidoglycan lytic transglycosylase
MHRKELAYMALALVTALGLLSVLVPAPPSAREQRGRASWYGPEFAGRPTASGERFSPQALTAAHRSLPLGTRAWVTNLETGQQVEVTLNDRGPFADPERRVLDTPRPRPRRAAQVARASRRPVSAERNPEKPQQLPQPAPGPWVVASRPAAPGASARLPTADHGPLDCRVTPKICLDGD